MFARLLAERQRGQPCWEGEWGEWLRRGCLRLFEIYPVSAGRTCDCLRRWAERGRGASLLRVLLRSFGGGVGVSPLVCALGEILRLMRVPRPTHSRSCCSGDVARPTGLCYRLPELVSWQINKHSPVTWFGQLLHGLPLQCGCFKSKIQYARHSSK